MYIQGCESPNTQLTFRHFLFKSRANGYVSIHSHGRLLNQECLFRFQNINIKKSMVI